MKYDRFKQLWDALVTDRSQSQQKAHAGVFITNGMDSHTAQILIDYGQGKTEVLDQVRVRLKAAKEAKKAATVTA